MSNKKWIKTNNDRPLEADHCEYGFIHWVDGYIDMVGVDDGISWDEASYFMPLYGVTIPSPPKINKVAIALHR